MTYFRGEVTSAQSTSVFENGTIQPLRQLDPDAVVVNPIITDKDHQAIDLYSRGLPGDLAAKKLDLKHPGDISRMLRAGRAELDCSLHEAVQIMLSSGELKLVDGETEFGQLFMNTLSEYDQRVLEVILKSATSMHAAMKLNMDWEQIGEISRWFYTLADVQNKASLARVAVAGGMTPLSKPVKETVFLTNAPAPAPAKPKAATPKRTAPRPQPQPMAEETTLAPVEPEIKLDSTASSGYTSSGVETMPREDSTIVRTATGELVVDESPTDTPAVEADQPKGDPEVPVASTDTAVAQNDIPVNEKEGAPADLEQEQIVTEPKFEPYKAAFPESVKSVDHQTVLIEAAFPGIDLRNKYGKGLTHDQLSLITDLIFDLGINSGNTSREDSLRILGAIKEYRAGHEVEIKLLSMTVLMARLGKSIKVEQIIAALKGRDARLFKNVDLAGDVFYRVKDYEDERNFVGYVAIGSTHQEKNDGADGDLAQTLTDLAAAHNHGGPSDEELETIAELEDGITIKI